MRISHVFLALLVATIWGINFVFVKLCLTEISPLLLCALRFLLASVPAIFFVKMPVASIRLIFLYGLVMFAMQFSLLFLGMSVGMTPGMAALLIQVQVFFSMFFAALFLDERPSIWQVLGALVSFMGIGLVALHFDDNISLLGFICILAASATWGVGNLITKKLKNTSMVTLVVWGSFFAIFPMFILSLLFEGTSSMVYTYHHLTWTGGGSLFFIVYGSTWVGYGVWNWLVRHYPVGVVVPFTLLVPIVGILSSALMLGESIQSWKIAAGLFVISGLCISLLSTYIFPLKLRQEVYES